MRIAARAGTASGIPAPHDRDEPSASAGELRTMASMSSFRVVVLEGEDGAPRIMSLASEADAPEGAATAVLVTAGADDARRIATLLGRRRR
jgi:hypothetical protein